MAKRTQRKINPPARGISAFFFFQKERRDVLKQQSPDLDNKNLIMQMSQEWNTMQQHEKSKYNQLAEKDRLRYEAELKEYKKKQNQKVESEEDSEEEDSDKEESEESKEKIVSKESNNAMDVNDNDLPSFLYFERSRRNDLENEYPDKNYYELIKLMLTEWNTMDRNSKNTFVERCKKDKENYENSLKNKKK
jgi:hypothetical protein